MRPVGPVPRVYRSVREKPRDTARSPKDVRKHKRGCDMRSNPTCQHTPTRGYQGTVSIHGSLGTGAFSNSPALYSSLTSPRTLTGPPPPVQDMVLGTPSPYPSRRAFCPEGPGGRKPWYLVVYELTLGIRYGKHTAREASDIRPQHKPYRYSRSMEHGKKTAGSEAMISTMGCKCG